MWKSGEAVTRKKIDFPQKKIGQRKGGVGNVFLLRELLCLFTLAYDAAHPRLRLAKAEMVGPMQLE